jgi:hypothetical protein
VIGGNARKQTLVDIEADQGGYGMHPDPIEGKDRKPGGKSGSCRRLPKDLPEPA